MQGGAGSSTIGQESSEVGTEATDATWQTNTTTTTQGGRSKRGVRREREMRSRNTDYDAAGEKLYQVDPLHYEKRDTNMWKQMWPYCRLCRIDVWDGHEETKRHKIRLWWEARAWDWSACDAEDEMNEADRHELENDWDWEPPGIWGPVVLEVRNVDTPLMTREEAEADATWKTKREIVNYLQQVASKTLVRDWKLTGSEDATMRRTSREHLLDAVNAVQTERAQPFATVKQRPGGTVNATEYGQNDQDQEEWEEPLVEEANSSSSSGPNDERANSSSSTGPNENGSANSSGSSSSSSGYFVPHRNNSSWYTCHRMQ
jgi:hypothetical protein